MSCVPDGCGRASCSKSPEANHGRIARASLESVEVPPLEALSRSIEQALESQVERAYTNYQIVSLYGAYIDGFNPLTPITKP
jgi:hypothetical protein